MLCIIYSCDKGFVENFIRSMLVNHPCIGVE
uniref:Uncharacterized protein n=1 Tax=Arundo donax TaxID=35708 RepID=A0A0A9BXV7_ARUDO